MGQLFSRIICGNQQIPLLPIHRSDVQLCSSENQKHTRLILDILPLDFVMLQIMKNAPELGTACKSLHASLPKIDRKPKYGSSRIWNGLKPSLHTPARMLPLCEYSCDFCNEKDQQMTMQGSNIYGVLFVCPECQHGLTTRLEEILGETLWELIDANRQIMVPRTNGPNELWYVSSRLPVIHHGTWHLCVQSHLDLMNGECLEKAVPVEKLKELNETIPA